MSSFPLTWSLAHFDCAERQSFLDWQPSAATEDYASVEVPGAVQVSSYGVPYAEILLRRNWLQVEWMEERLWVYRTELPACDVPAGSVRVVRFLGLDYETRIFLNGRLAAAHEGMFSAVELELDPETAGRANTIHVAFLPPKFLSTTISTDSLNANAGRGIPHMKARFMEGWDFAPRLRCVGIWDDVEVFTAAPTRIRTLTVQTRLENISRAEVAVMVHLNRSLPQGRLHLKLAGQTIEVPIHARDQACVVFPLTDPELWYPHTHGPATLLPLTVHLLDDAGQPLDTAERQIGLREVKRVPARGQFSGDTPVQFVINGQPVFLLGANLCPFSSIPGLVKAEDYRRVLQPLRDAGINFLRIWGGGVKEKSCFYRLCNEMGFLVMQEFPLACQLICHDPAYLAILAQEARAYVRDLGAHPCIIWWTGGNEHYHFWEALDSGTDLMNAIRDRMRGRFGIAAGDRTWRGGEDPNHPGLRMLHGIVQEELPSLPYNVTSGMEDQGETHGPWNLRLAIGDHRFRDFDFFDFWRTTGSHLLSESSVAAAANPAMFSRVLALPNELTQTPLPATREEPDWVAHKAFHACWDAHPDLWLDITDTEAWFGPLENLADLIFANHYLQCEASRFMIEAVRRRQGETTGIFWWGANEPFPALAGNALVDFYGETKPVLSVIAQSTSPRALSLSYTRCVLCKLKADLVFINSLPTHFAGSYRVIVSSETTGEIVDRYEGRVALAGYSTARVCPLTPVPLTLEMPVVIVDVDLLAAGGDILQQQRYRFFAQDKFPLRSLLSRSRQNPASLFTVDH